MCADGSGHVVVHVAIGERECKAWIIGYSLVVKDNVNTIVEIPIKVWCCDWKRRWRLRGRRQKIFIRDTVSEGTCKGG